MPEEGQSAAGICEGQDVLKDDPDNVEPRIQWNVNLI